MSGRAWMMWAALLATGCAGGTTDAQDSTSTSSSALRQCATGATVAGVDVSSDDGTIDWEAVSDPGRGNKTFAFLRVGDGSYADPKFAANWKGAADVGMYRGAYIYFRASDDPATQAQAVLDAIGGKLEGPLDLPPVLDLETEDGMSVGNVVHNAESFVQHIYGALGRKPLVYIAAGFAQQLGDPSGLAEYPLWVANWSSSCPTMPAAWSSWRFWQNAVAPSGTVSGIDSSETDLDTFNGSLAELAAYAAERQGLALSQPA